MEGDRVRGVRGPDGATEEAEIVIGADGMHSLVARTVQAPEYNTLPSLSFGYYAYFSGIHQVGGELHFLDTEGVLVFPTNDGNVCIGVGGQADRFHEFRDDIEGNLLRVLDKVPELRRARPWGQARGALSGHRRPAELLPQALRTRLGARRRCRLPSRLHHRSRHHRRVS